MYLIQKNSQTELNDFNPFKTKDQTDTNAYKPTRAQLLTVDYTFSYFYNSTCYTYFSIAILHFPKPLSYQMMMMWRQSSAESHMMVMQMIIARHLWTDLLLQI